MLLSVEFASRCKNMKPVIEIVYGIGILNVQ